MMNDLKNEKARRFPLRAGLLVVAIGAVAAAGLLQGCGGGGGGGGACGDGAIQVSWDFTAGSTGCFAGDQVTVRVDDNSMLVNFDCAAGNGTTPDVEGGVTHTVDLTLFDSGGQVVAGPSPAALVTVPCGGVVSAGIYDFTD
ncbi:MAG TPA: hypothetical protein VLA14_01170 [Polyangia bacterium]|jgi:hypothetical protein|nr:hypothetical protein [Polyangia bacterium]